MRESRNNIALRVCKIASDNSHKAPKNTYPDRGAGKNTHRALKKFRFILLCTNKEPTFHCRSQGSGIPVRRRGLHMFRMFRLDVSIAHARVSKQGHITDLPKYNRTEFSKEPNGYSHILYDRVPGPIPTRARSHPHRGGSGPHNKLNVVASFNTVLSG